MPPTSNSILKLLPFDDDWGMHFLSWLGTVVTFLEVVPSKSLLTGFHVHIETRDAYPSLGLQDCSLPMQSIDFTAVEPKTTKLMNALRYVLASHDESIAC